MDFERTRRRFTPIRRRLCVGSGSGEVLLLELDGTSGKIDLFGAARSGDYPSFLAFHKSRAVAYAAHEASSARCCCRRSRATPASYLGRPNPWRTTFASVIFAAK